MRTLLLSAALMAPSVASAGVGFGTTMGFGDGQNVLNLGNGRGLFAATAGGFLPSLDLHFDKFRLQIHALESVATLLNDEEIFLGANGYIGVFDAPIGGSWTAVIAPGAGLDLQGDPLVVNLTAESQFGVQTDGPTGIGVYVVPALGVSVTDVDSFLIAAGTLQVSLWFGGRSSGSTSSPAL